MNILTRRNYKLLDCASVLQKSIRRNDPKTAGYFALELFMSGYGAYVWKRLLTVSAEDCYGIVTQEIKALHDSYIAVNTGRKAKEHGGRIFISKAVLILCACWKNRDPDHLQNFVYDRKIGMSDEEAIAAIREATRDQDPMEIPDYAFDCHTELGKSQGKTKMDFFKAEQEGLSPRQIGLFDNVDGS